MASFDQRYEFCAPKFYDFSASETPEEAAAAQLWFETPKNYSPLLPRNSTKKSLGGTDENLESKNVENNTEKPSDPEGLESEKASSSLVRGGESSEEIKKISDEKFDAEKICEISLQSVNEGSTEKVENKDISKELSESQEESAVLNTEKGSSKNKSNHKVSEIHETSHVVESTVISNASEIKELRESHKAAVLNSEESSFKNTSNHKVSEIHENICGVGSTVIDNASETKDNNNNNSVSNNPGSVSSGTRTEYFSDSSSEYLSALSNSKSESCVSASFERSKYALPVPGVHSSVTSISFEPSQQIQKKISSTGKAAGSSLSESKRSVQVIDGSMDNTTTISNTSGHENNELSVNNVREITSLNSGNSEGDSNKVNNASSQNISGNSGECAASKHETRNTRHPQTKLKEQTRGNKRMHQVQVLRSVQEENQHFNKRQKLEGGIPKQVQEPKYMPLIRPLPTLTVPQEFHFHTEDRFVTHRGLHCHAFSEAGGPTSPYVPLAEKVLKFESERHYFQPENQTLKLTRPKEPELMTSQRARPSKFKSTAELEEEMLNNIPKFKARPINKRILEAPTLPAVTRTIPQLPEFQEFNLRTQERAQMHSSNASSNTFNSVDTSVISSYDKGTTALSRGGVSSSFGSVLSSNIEGKGVKSEKGHLKRSKVCSQSGNQEPTVNQRIFKENSIVPLASTNKSSLVKSEILRRAASDYELLCPKNIENGVFKENVPHLAKSKSDFDSVLNDKDGHARVRNFNNGSNRRPLSEIPKNTQGNSQTPS